MLNQQNILDNSWDRAREHFGVLERVLDPETLDLETIELGSSLVSKCPIDRVIEDERCLMFREISHG